jgi:DNA-binding CsgD family transcriptional regulator
MPGRALLIGPAGTVRDLVASVLGRAGLAVEALTDVDLTRILTMNEEHGVTESDVLVVVSPAPGEWHAARDFGGGVVLVTERHPGDTEVVEAILAGADAIVHPDDSPAELVTAVVTVSQGGTLLDAAQTRLLAEAARQGSTRRSAQLYLTPRERSILRSAERGESVKQTARSLGISPKTVENLQSRLFRKLGARNRAHAVVLAHRAGLLSETEALAS